MNEKLEALATQLKMLFNFTMSLDIEHLESFEESFSSHIDQDEALGVMMNPNGAQSRIADKNARLKRTRAVIHFYNALKDTQKDLNEAKESAKEEKKLENLFPNLI